MICDVGIAPPIWPFFMVLNLTKMVANEFTSIANMASKQKQTN
jgi:hypothetical protein